MLYTKLKYPAVFGVLKPEIRKKAIEIANVLLEEGLERDLAETIAFCNARLIGQEMAFNTNSSIADCAIHIIPHPDGWALISPDAKNLYSVYESQKEARHRARMQAKCVKFKLYVHNTKGYIEDTENFIVNKPQTVAINRPAVARVSNG